MCHDARDEDSLGKVYGKGSNSHNLPLIKQQHLMCISADGNSFVDQVLMKSTTTYVTTLLSCPLTSLIPKRYFCCSTVNVGAAVFHQ